MENVVPYDVRHAESQAPEPSEDIGGGDSENSGSPADNAEPSGAVSGNDGPDATDEPDGAGASQTPDNGLIIRIAAAAALAAAAVMICVNMLGRRRKNR